MKCVCEWKLYWLCMIVIIMSCVNVFCGGIVWVNGFLMCMLYDLWWVVRTYVGFYKEKRLLWDIVMEMNDMVMIDYVINRESEMLWVIKLMVVMKHWLIECCWKLLIDGLFEWLIVLNHTIVIVNWDNRGWLLIDYWNECLWLLQRRIEF